jgi:hypothetical protein
LAFVSIGLVVFTTRASPPVLVGLEALIANKTSEELDRVSFFFEIP